MSKLSVFSALLLTSAVLSACDMEPKWTRVCDEWKVKVNPNVAPPNRHRRTCEQWVYRCKAGMLDSDQCEEAARPPEATENGS